MGYHQPLLPKQVKMRHWWGRLARGESMIEVVVAKWMTPVGVIEMKLCNDWRIASSVC